MTRWRRCQFDDPGHCMTVLWALTWSRLGSAYCEFQQPDSKTLTEKRIAQHSAVRGRRCGLRGHCGRVACDLKIRVA